MGMGMESGRVGRFLIEDCSSNQSAEDGEARGLCHQGQFLLPRLLRPCPEGTGDSGICSKQTRYVCRYLLLGHLGAPTMVDSVPA